MRKKTSQNWSESNAKLCSEHHRNGNVLQNLDSSNVLKTEIAYRPLICLYSRPWHEITAMAKNHGTRRKSRKSRQSWIRDFLTALL